VSWRAVVAALDESELLRSRVSVYRHPLGGRSILWHTLRALLDVDPPPSRVCVLHRAAVQLTLDDDWSDVALIAVEAGDEARALRAAVAWPGMTVLVDGAAPLISPLTVSRLLRAAENGVATVMEAREHAVHIAVAGEGPALASAEDPRVPQGASRVAPTALAELLQVSDRHTLSMASVAVRDRVVRSHQVAGVSFLLPDTTWVDVDVRIGADTLIYPGVVLEGATRIGGECVIGPHTRLVEATIGRGVELKGWNYITRTSVRNHAVLEPYERRGLD
jgi:bifunctional N-acetylglucosamine-1-phosphate-uridyltransferase/glucosamine-1-phosphate-acetyltransferase GlmU-like protein